MSSSESGSFARGRGGSLVHERDGLDSEQVTTQTRFSRNDAVRINRSQNNVVGVHEERYAQLESPFRIYDNTETDLVDDRDIRICNNDEQRVSKPTTSLIMLMD